MSDGIHGHGADLSIAGTDIGNIISISGPEISRDAIDKSTMDSTNKWREFIPGMLDGGEITMEVNYDGTAAGTGNTLAAQLTNSAQVVVVEFNNGGTTSSWNCSALITGIGHAIPFDDKVSQTVTMKVAGAITFTDEA
jgi:predicted secreted protein